MYQLHIEHKPLLRLILILFDKLCSMSNCVSLPERTFIRRKSCNLMKNNGFKRVLLATDLKIYE